MTASVRAACSVVAPPGRPYRQHPPTSAFYQDLLAPFGVPFDEGLLRAGRNVSHQDLVDRLIEDDRVRSCAPELIIVSSALPDVHPFTTVASHLNMLVGGGTATSFGISEQGLAGPFTALRIATSFADAGRCQQALIAVVEQTTLPGRFPLVHDNALVDSGVLLVLGTSDGLRVAGVETAADPEQTTSRLAELAGKDPERTLLVLGPWVAESGLGERFNCQQADPGCYGTSVWLVLAAQWQAWQGNYDTVVLCDTEPRTGEGHLAILRSEP